MQNSLAVAKRVQDILREPATEKEKIEVYLHVLGAYLKTVTDINEKYNEQLRSSISDLTKLKRIKAELS